MIQNKRSIISNQKYSTMNINRKKSLKSISVSLDAFGKKTTFNKQMIIK